MSLNDREPEVTIHQREITEEKLAPPPIDLPQIEPYTPEPPKQQYQNETCTKCRNTKECRICEDCHGFFCDGCASIFDTNICIACLPTDAVEIKEEPLIDEDGVTHKGKHVIPIGDGYKTLATRICEMTDFQLETHIDKFKLLIHEAEKTLEYRRIALAVGEIEKAERGQKKLRGLKLNTPQGVVKITGQQLRQAKVPGGTNLLELLTKLKAAGITPEKLKAALEAKQKEAKNGPVVAASPK